MKEYAKKYSVGEQMAVALSKEICEGQNVFIGIGLPLSGAILAKFSHAPNITLATEGGFIGVNPVGAMATITDTAGAPGCFQFVGIWRVLSDLQRGYFDLGIIGGAQIDKFGNINSTAYFDNVKFTYSSPKIRLPGSGGANDIASSSTHTILMLIQEKRRFVEKVDYITSPGYLSGPGDRERANLVGKGPLAVVTTKGIFRFDENTKEMYLDTVYPGVKVKDIIKEVSWDLKVGKEIKEAEPPTTEEIVIMRRIDPTDIILQEKNILDSLNFFEWAEMVEKGWEGVIKDYKR